MPYGTCATDEVDQHHDGAWIWILQIMCNIIIHEHNSVLILQASFLQYLVCVAHISLIVVVSVTSWSCKKHVPSNSPQASGFFHPMPLSWLLQLQQTAMLTKLASKLPANPSIPSSLSPILSVQIPLLLLPIQSHENNQKTEGGCRLHSYRGIWSSERQREIPIALVIELAPKLYALFSTMKFYEDWCLPVCKCCWRLLQDFPEPMLQHPHPLATNPEASALFQCNYARQTTPWASKNLVHLKFQHLWTVYKETCTATTQKPTSSQMQ